MSEHLALLKATVSKNPKEKQQADSMVIQNMENPNYLNVLLQCLFESTNDPLLIQAISFAILYMIKSKWNFSVYGPDFSHEIVLKLAEASIQNPLISSYLNDSISIIYKSMKGNHNIFNYPYKEELLPFLQEGFHSLSNLTAENVEQINALFTIAVIFADLNFVYIKPEEGGTKTDEYCNILFPYFLNVLTQISTFFASPDAYAQAQSINQAHPHFMNSISSIIHSISKVIRISLSSISVGSQTDSFRDIIQILISSFAKTLLQLQINSNNLKMVSSIFLIFSTVTRKVPIINEKDPNRTALYNQICHQYIPQIFECFNLSFNAILQYRSQIKEFMSHPENASNPIYTSLYTEFSNFGIFENSVESDISHFLYNCVKLFRFCVQKTRKIEPFYSAFHSPEFSTFLIECARLNKEELDDFFFNPLVYISQNFQIDEPSKTRRSLLGFFIMECRTFLNPSLFASFTPGTNIIDEEACFFILSHLFIKKRLADVSSDFYHALVSTTPLYNKEAPFVIPALFHLFTNGLIPVNDAIQLSFSALGSLDPSNQPSITTSISASSLLSSALNRSFKGSLGDSNFMSELLKRIMFLVTEIHSEDASNLLATLAGQYQDFFIEYAETTIGMLIQTWIGITNVVENDPNGNEDLETQSQTIMETIKEIICNAPKSLKLVYEAFIRFSIEAITQFPQNSCIEQILEILGEIFDSSQETNELMFHCAYNVIIWLGKNDSSFDLLHTAAAIFCSLVNNCSRQSKIRQFLSYEEDGNNFYSMIVSLCDEVQKNIDSLYEEPFEAAMGIESVIMICGGSTERATRAIELFEYACSNDLNYAFPGIFYMMAAALIATHGQFLNAFTGHENALSAFLSFSPYEVYGEMAMHYFALAEIAKSNAPMAINAFGAFCDLTPKILKKWMMIDKAVMECEEDFFEMNEEEENHESSVFNPGCNLPIISTENPINTFQHLARIPQFASEVPPDVSEAVENCIEISKKK